MKRIVSFLIAFTLIFSITFALASCNDTKEEEKASTQSSKNEDSSQPSQGDDQQGGSNNSNNNDNNGGDENEDNTPLAPAIIGVIDGTFAEYYVKGDTELGFSGINGYEDRGFENGISAINALKNGEIRYVLIDSSLAQSYMKNVDGLKVVSPSLTNELYAIGVSKNQPDLKDSINKILTQKEAEIQDIIKKYAIGEDVVGITSALKDVSKANEQLVIATNTNFYPLEYRIGEKFAGIDIEIAALIARELGLELVILDVAFESLLTCVNNDMADIAISGITYIQDRGDFTDIYYDASLSLITLENDSSFDECTTDKDILNKLQKLK